MGRTPSTTGYRYLEAPSDRTRVETWREGYAGRDEVSIHSTVRYSTFGVRIPTTAARWTHLDIVTASATGVKVVTSAQGTCARVATFPERATTHASFQVRAFPVARHDADPRPDGGRRLVFRLRARRL